MIAHVGVTVDGIVAQTSVQLERLAPLVSHSAKVTRQNRETGERIKSCAMIIGEPNEFGATRVTGAA